MAAGILARVVVGTLASVGAGTLARSRASTLECVEVATLARVVVGTLSLMVAVISGAHSGGNNASLIHNSVIFFPYRDYASC